MPRPGLFGKLPAAGDFVNRGFSPVLCEKLDALIQTALGAAAAEAGGVREVMEQSWPVMIVIRPGALCETGFSGLWLPSQDRVGRSYPLCIGHELPSAEANMAMPWPSRVVTGQLLRSGLEATQQGLGADDLLARLPTSEEWESDSIRELPFSSSSDETVPDVACRGSMFALQGPEERMTVPSRALGGRLPWVVEVLGTVIGADGQALWFFGSRSTLAWTHFAALFDGRWDHWSWAVSPCALPNMEDAGDQNGANRVANSDTVA